MAVTMATCAWLCLMVAGCAQLFYHIGQRCGVDGIGHDEMGEC